jgi:mono/diheme cytochrome c family protein
MKQRSHPLLKRALTIMISSLQGLLLLGTILLIFILSGLYNIAASHPQSITGRWMLATAINNSVRCRADAKNVPLLESLDWENGFRNFDNLCVGCHGAPGVPPSAIGNGLQPEPPDLSLCIDDWSTAELFWITENGVKFTGMPGFGKTHSAAEIWNIIAFVKALPVTSGDEYQRLRDWLGNEVPEEYEPFEPPAFPDFDPGDRQRLILRQAI